MVRVGNGGASRRRPLRNSIDKRSVGVGLPDDPKTALRRTLPAGHMGPALQEYCASRAGRTESSAPTNRSVGAGVPDGPLSPAAMLSVGRGALTPPPGLVPHFHVKSLSLRGRNAPVAIRSSRSLRKGITDSHVASLLGMTCRDPRRYAPISASPSHMPNDRRCQKRR